MKLGQKIAAGLCGLIAPLYGQYAGPALLTRGEAPAAMSVPAIHFRPYVELAGVYDTGLADVSVNSHGDLADSSSLGIAVTWGVSGVHSWAHTKVGLDYRGSVSHYVGQSAYDSINQSMLLGVTHQLSKHTVLSLRENAGTFSRDIGLLGLPQTVPFDPSSSHIPTTDFFDNRTIYLSTQGSLTLQKSARLSFNIAGDGILTRRRATALNGVTGAGAQGDAHYRLTRQTTVGVSYSFNHFDFTRVLSNTDTHGLVGTYSVRLTRRWEFSAYGGAMRVESKYLQNVPIDPVIAALLGVTGGSQIVHDQRYIPHFGLRASRTFQRSVAYVGGGHSATAGNGLFLTSEATSVLAGYSYTWQRAWSFSAQGAYTRSQSISNFQGVYADATGTVTAAYQVHRSVHATFHYSARQYSSPDYTKYNRLIHETRIGIGFTPGDVPLRIW